MNTKRCTGFTVIELIVAISIVCLLVVVAVGSFYDHMSRKSRVEAQRALIEAAEWLQNQHATSGTFQVELPVRQVPGDGNAVYRIRLASTAVVATDPKATFPATTASTYTLQAEPLEDDTCGTLLLDSNGRPGVVGKDALLAKCWR
jgi:type IV pilus assembly protein PilE